VKRLFATAVLLAGVTALAAAAASTESDSHGSITEHHAETIPSISKIVEAGERLSVVATTSIVADVLANIAGDLVDITVLVQRGQNPHGYEPTPAALRAIERADLVFVNGLGLEEGTLADMADLTDAPIVPVSVGIVPIEFGGHDEDEHAEDDHGEEHGEDDHDHAEGSPDPHVWTDPANVAIWTRNVAEVLSQADPTNAVAYASSAERYEAVLRDLDDEIRGRVSAIPAEDRVLVLDHESFAYFARAYGFDIVGTIVPGTTDRAEPSAQEIARLVGVLRETGAPAIFVGRTASRGLEQLAQTVAGEVGRPVRIVSMLTGSLAPKGEEGDTYVGFMRYNVDRIVEALSK
jgi:ABC-type Zn uptake system ZnuABC Zn-binding protein ZnuA